MIFGDCPYNDCDELQMVPCAEKTPCFSKETCEGCGREYWQKHSRIDPESYTLQEFEEKYIMDHETKQITERNPAPPLSDVEKLVLETLVDQISDEIINGTGSGEPMGFLTPSKN
jgi:hypothetical protein